MGSPGEGQFDLESTLQSEGTFEGKFEEAKYVWDDNCKDNRPPFNVGRWIKVNRETCPVAFNDPEFDRFESHDQLCNNDELKDIYGDNVEVMWTYPEYGFCKNTVTCLACPALADCGPAKQTSSSKECRCNGLVIEGRDGRLQGECTTRYRGKFFCYVDSRSGCPDKKRSQSLDDGFYSAEACN